MRTQSGQGASAASGFGAETLALKPMVVFPLPIGRILPGRSLSGQ
jgi:hypothetical protein